MSDATLAEIFERTCRALDVERRAWIVAAAHCVDPLPAPAPRLAAVAQRAMDSGEVPAGPYAFRPGPAALDVSGADRQVELTCHLDGGRRLQGRITLEESGVLCEALTRSGHLDDGSHEPSHVMLSDVESVLVDMVHLVEACAAETGYRGAVRLMLGVACEIPGTPLELRVYDEAGGDLLRPAAGYDRFDPVILEYPVPLGEAERAHLLWDTAVAIGYAFGVFLPQLVGQARQSIEPLPGPGAAAD